MTAEDLKRIVLENDSERSYMTVISNPNANEEVLKLVIEKTNDPVILIEILESPLINSELFKLISEKESVISSSNEMKRHLLKSKFLTGETFNKLLDNVDISFFEELINSPFCDEEKVIKLLNKFISGFEKENFLMVINCPYFTGKVIDKIAVNVKLDDELAEILLKSGKLSDDNYKTICSRYLDKSEYSPHIISLMIEDNRCDLDLLEKISRNTAKSATENLRTILVDPKLSTDMKIRLIDERIKGSVLIELLKEEGLTEEILLAIANKKYCFSADSNDSYLYSRSGPSSRDLTRGLLDYPEVTGDVITAMVNNRTLLFDRDKVLEHPKANHSVKAGVIIRGSSVSGETLDKFLNIDGLDAEDILKLLDNHFTKEIVLRVLNYDKVTDNRIYKVIIDKVYSTSLKEYRLDIFDQLLNKDINEHELCTILTKETNNDSYRINFDVIRKVMNHPNAGLNLSRLAINVSDKISDNDKKKELLEKSDAVKHKIMSSIYDIEEEDDVTAMLRMNVEDGMSTMLWGPSGVGKSSRVFEIDPTATLLILKNGMLPEEVIGGKEPNGEPGVIYPPHWYDTLCEKCEREPNRQHILFIDEFTNVSDTIKNLVWEVIGNRLVNGHEEFPLPENCSIVVAGNRPEESSAVRIDANGGVMPAPLHNRIDSMLEIQFDVDEWQKWALETDAKTGNLRIHPIVYSFCMANADKCMFTNFNPEDVTQPFLTPRKWEALSKALYKAEERGKNHHISNARIISILGNNNIAAAFIAHYERLPIDMERIVMGTYSEDDFPTIEDKLYALGMVIAEYNGDPIAVESFILECLGDEYLSIYNTMKGVRDATLNSTNNNSVAFKGVK